MLLMAGCWRSSSPPVTPRSAATSATPSESSYGHVTLAIDAVGVGMIAGGMLVYGAYGLESKPASVLVGVGGLTAGLGTAITHVVHGQHGRAVATYAMRSGLASVGLVTASAISCANERETLCELTPNMTWGIAGGLAVAGALDALFLHGSDSTWSPIVTPSDDGARVGIATSF
jgi:hypothetical protein